MTLQGLQTTTSAKNTVVHSRSVASQLHPQVYLILAGVPNAILMFCS